ncbi:hypothetical protein CCR75_004882 [Bremia lactucae]|uniref:Uncharacterized protein n=1 Tax=Bremia lactucae TaxID=4779 RepID=A0A976IHU3_BRELC|nr:hypothetical protein CCR75_004882 [Bremia lactucae]
MYQETEGLIAHLKNGNSNEIYNSMQCLQPSFRQCRMVMKGAQPESGRANSTNADDPEINSAKLDTLGLPRQL